MASFERLISFFGRGVEFGSVFNLVMSAADKGSSEAHLSAALRLLLANNPSSGGDSVLELKAFEFLSRYGGLNELAVRYSQLLISDGAYEVAKSVLSEALDDLVDDEDLFEAQMLLGDVELSLGNLPAATEAFRCSVTLRSEYGSLSALAFSYLKNQEHDLAQHTYEILRTRGEDLQERMEGVVGKIVSLDLLGRRGASEKLLTELERANLNSRARDILELADRSVRSAVLTQTEKESDPTDVNLRPDKKAASVTRQTPRWAEIQDAVDPHPDKLQIRQAWQLQRQSWHRSVLLTTPKLTRRTQVINRGLRELLMPDGSPHLR